MRLILASILVCGLWFQVFGQKTLVFGRIVEANSGSPVSYATIAFKGSTEGVYSDEVGNYFLESSGKQDTVTIAALGYNDTSFTITPGIRQEVNIRLTSAEYNLDEVVVRAGENPAFEILRKVIENKKYNDPEQFQTYQYTSYNKVQFDLNNFTDRIKKDLVFKQFPFIWEYQDTMPNGVRYLPFLFKENVREHYYRKNPTAYKEYITAKRDVQFFRGPKIEAFIKELYLNPNVYENFVVILQKSFPSPINDNFQRYYKYYLTDTLVTLDGLPCHHIRFLPKGKSDVAFTGDMYIHDSTFAVKRIDLNFSIEANINFLRSFYLRIDYEWVNQQKWFAKALKVLADFTVLENSEEMTGFFGKRYSEFKDIRLDEPISNDKFAPVETVIETDNMENRDTNFWLEERVDTLSDEELGIFEMVDTIQNNRRFKIIKKLFTVSATGWLPFKNFELGHMLTLISYNNIEGARPKIGIRTPIKSNLPFRGEAYVAYGIKDERFKYYTQFDYFLKKDFGKHTAVGFTVQEDVDQVGLSYNAARIDNIMTFFLRTAEFDNRTFLKAQSLYIEQQWFLGFVTRLGLYAENVRPFGNYNFFKKNNLGEQEVVPSFNMGGIKLSGRFAFGQTNINAKFYDAGTQFWMLKYPTVSFEYANGIKGFLNSDFDYHALRLRVEHQQKLNRWGYLKYIVEGGKIWGEVPYLYLGIPFGTQSIIADDAAFNMMNFLEFVGDEYVSIHLEHHFEGLIFNKIPLIRKLKLRSFVFGKAFIGKVSAKNDQATYLYPENLYSIREPYYEVGFGIENILKLGRVDFIWRLNYKDHPDTYDFLPKPSFQLRF
jgi:hypothetical protein